MRVDLWLPASIVLALAKPPARPVHTGPNTGRLEVRTPIERQRAAGR